MSTTVVYRSSESPMIKKNLLFVSYSLFRSLNDLVARSAWAKRTVCERTKCYPDVGQKIPEVPFKLKTCVYIKHAQWKICVENLGLLFLQIHFFSVCFANLLCLIKLNFCFYFCFLLWSFFNRNFFHNLCALIRLRRKHLSKIWLKFITNFYTEIWRLKICHENGFHTYIA